MRATSCMGRSLADRANSIFTTWPGIHGPPTITAAPPSLRFRQCPGQALVVLDTTPHTATAASTRRRGNRLVCPICCAFSMGLDLFRGITMHGMARRQPNSCRTATITCRSAAAPAVYFLRAENAVLAFLEHSTKEELRAGIPQSKLILNDPASRWRSRTPSIFRRAVP